MALIIPGGGSTSRHRSIVRRRRRAAVQSDGKSYSLDGVDERIHIDGVAGTGDFNWQGDAFTVSTWFKSSHNGLQYLWSFAKAGTSSTSWCGLRIQSNYVWMMGYSSGASLVGTPVSPQGNNGYFGVKNTDTNGINPIDGNWHHAVVTVAGTSNTEAAARMYVDGNYVAYAKQKSSSLNMGDFTVGCLRRKNGNSVQNFLNGKVAQLSLYTSALSATQVTALYGNGSPPDETQLTPSPDHYYRFGDGDTRGPSTLTDYGSGDVDGTGTNMEAADIVEDHP